MQDNKFLNLIRLVNQHLNIHLVTGKLTPASAGGISEEEGIIGHNNDQIEEFHEINNIQVKKNNNNLHHGYLHTHTHTQKIILE